MTDNGRNFDIFNRYNVLLQLNIIQKQKPNLNQTQNQNQKPNTN